MKLSHLERSVFNHEMYSFLCDSFWFFKTTWGLYLNCKARCICHRWSTKYTQSQVHACWISTKLQNYTGIGHFRTYAEADSWSVKALPEFIDLCILGHSNPEEEFSGSLRAKSKLSNLINLKWSQEVTRKHLKRLWRVFWGVAEPKGGKPQVEVPLFH